MSKTEINQLIDQNSDLCIKLLTDLIQSPSSDLQATKAQTIVKQWFEKLSLKVDSFDTDSMKYTHLPDYSPMNEKFHSDSYNLIATTPKKHSTPSLILFAHIDTERGNLFDYQISDTKVFGLGSCDDKGGIASMILACYFYQQIYGELPFNLSLMSLIGKHGGIGGSIQAFYNNYQADAAIYLHPAETGLGLNEIKSISLGVIDLRISVDGQPNKAHHDLDPGLSANHRLIELANLLLCLNQQRLKDHQVDNQPMTKMNIGLIHGGQAVGKVSTSAHFDVRIHFYQDETIDSIITEITNYLNQQTKNNPLFTDATISIVKGQLRANPAMVDQDHRLIKTVTKNITGVTTISNFTYTAHGASDIRFPIIYADTPTIGVGCKCHLPTENQPMAEWLDIEEYIQSVKVIANIMVDWFN